MRAQKIAYYDQTNMIFFADQAGFKSNLAR